MLPKFEEHIGLAFYYAKQYHGFLKDSKTLEFADLFSVAKIALLKACNDFDPAKGVPFANHASLYMRQQILQEVNKFGNTIKIDYRVKKAKQVIDDLLAQDIHFDDLKDYNITESQLAYYKNYSSTSEMGDDTDMTDETTEDDFQDIDEDLLKEMYRHIEKLTEKEQYIIKSWFGICGYKKKTLIVLGAEENVGKHAMAQRKDRIVKKLYLMMKHLKQGNSSKKQQSRGKE